MKRQQHKRNYKFKVEIQFTYTNLTTWSGLMIKRRLRPTAVDEETVGATDDELGFDEHIQFQ